MQFLLFIVVALVAIMISFQMNRRTPMAQALTTMGATAGLFRIVGLLALLAAGSQTITLVDAGTVGVLKVFGKIEPRVLYEGVNFRNPFADVIKMNIKTQEQLVSMQAPSKENLTVGLEISVLFHLDPVAAPEVVRNIGSEQEYIRKILLPNFRSVVRNVSAVYEAKAVYASSRAEVATAIETQLRAAVGERGIIIETTPLRNVILPSDLAAAIEEKLRAEQESQRMEFVLDKERKEAERKKIEATGIAVAQKIVDASLTANVLRWKGIEATDRLANSPNAKVVIIGSGKDGLPIILGGNN